MSSVLKLKCQGEVHRILLPEGELTYEVVRNAIHEVYPDSTGTAKYIDEENDLCTLCPGSFSDFVELSGEHKGRKVLKLELYAPPSCAAAGVVNSTQDKPGAEVKCPWAAMVKNMKAGSMEGEHPIAAMIKGMTEGNLEGEHPMAAMMKDVMKGNADGVNPMADMMKIGMGIFKAFAQQDGNDSFRSGSKGGCKGQRGGCRGFLGEMRRGFALLQLRKNGELNAASVAALAAHSLPKALSFAAEHAEKIDWKAKAKLSELRPVLEDLRMLIASTQGLEECEPKIVNVLENDGASVSEALLALLSALSTLPFEAQIKFFKALYVSQEHRLQEVFAKVDEHMAWMPTIPLEHEGITCDGCGKCPIKGLRFKCKDCPDYDLCSACFGSKDSVHGGECSTHEFEMKVFPFSCHPGTAKGCWFGKGMGKRGKGKGKGKHHHFGMCGSDSKQEEPKACAREGCGFAVTWHPTHCCQACASFEGQHGPRCEQKPAAVAAAAEVEASPMLQEQSKTESQEFRDREPDFTFPVQVEDGRRLHIAWNKTDDLEQVAHSFAHEHHIPQEELPTIKAFLEHATAMSGDVGEKSEATPTGRSKQDEDEETLNQAKIQLEAMGFGFGDSDVLLELLKSNGGSVQKVIEILTADGQ